MAIERTWVVVPPQSITSNGTSDGHISVADSTLFYVKRKVVVFSDAVGPMSLEIKRINNINDMELGPPGDIKQRSNLQLILTSDNPMISAPDEQARPTLSMEEVIKAAYANEPAVALRNMLVDVLGNKIDSSVGSDGKNRLAVDADVTIDNLQLLDKPYDSGTETYPTSTQTILITYVGGLSGTPVQRIILNFSDSSQNNLLNFERSNWNGSIWVIG